MSGILLVGDAILDVYFHVEKPTRISPEAAIPIHPMNGPPSFTWGGAAAVAEMLVVLGAEELKFVTVADRVPGLNSFNNAVAPPPNRKMPTKYRVMHHASHLMRIDHEDLSPYGATVEGELVGRAALQGGEAPDLIMFSDYKKGVCSRRVVSSIVAMYPGTPFIVDPPCDAPWGKYKGAYCVKANKAEAGGVHMNSVHKATAEFLIVTDGRDGSTIFGRSGSVQEIDARRSMCLDPTGAGDQYFAMFGLCIAQGCSIEVAANAASHAAGMSVERIGHCPVTLEEMERDGCSMPYS